MNVHQRIQPLESYCRRVGVGHRRAVVELQLGALPTQRVLRAPGAVATLSSSAAATSASASAAVSAVIKVPRLAPATPAAPAAPAAPVAPAVLPERERENEESRSLAGEAVDLKLINCVLV